MYDEVSIYPDDETAYRQGYGVGERDNRRGFCLFRPTQPITLIVPYIKGYIAGWEETAEGRLPFFNRERGLDR